MLVRIHINTGGARRQMRLICDQRKRWQRLQAFDDRGVGVRIDCGCIHAVFQRLAVDR